MSTPTPTATPADTVDFPTRQIEWLIPSSPGGGTDYWPRVVSRHWGDYLPNDVDSVHRNQTAAGGIVALNQLWNADPDGYTLLHGNLSSYAPLQFTSDQVEYDTREFTQLGSPAQPYRSLFGRVDFFEEYDTWDKLTAAIRDGVPNFATHGVGSSGHLIPAIYADLTGDYEIADLNLVHHTGTGDAIPSLLRGDVDLMYTTHTSAVPYTTEEDDLMLAFVIRADHDEYPTHVDFGVDPEVAPDVASLTTNVRCFWGPPGIPDTETEILREAIWGALHDDDLVAEVEETGRWVEAIHGDDMQPQVDTYVQLTEDVLAPLVEQLQEETR